MKRRDLTNKALLGLTLSLIVPSLSTVHKYAGISGTLLYIFAVPGVILAGKKYVFDWFRSTINERIVLCLFGVTFLAIITAFLTIYPIANSGIVGGGSDADDALDIATRELLEGRYPFYVQTYLGNPIGPLPGALLLAVPFVLLGTSAFQNLFWLGAFFFLARWILNDSRSALLLVWSILLLSPGVMAQVVTGSDDLSNAIYVLAFLMLLLFSRSRSGFALLASALLGISLSARSNFLLILPLVLAALVTLTGWKCALRHIVIVCFSFAVVTTPFWFYDPAGFTPLHTQYSKVSQFNEVLPFSGLFIPLASGLVGIWIISRRTLTDFVMLLQYSGVVLAVPVVVTTAFSIWQNGLAGLIWTNYGVFFLPFTALGFWAEEFSSREDRASYSGAPYHQTSNDRKCAA